LLILLCFCLLPITFVAVGLGCFWCETGAVLFRHFPLDADAFEARLFGFGQLWIKIVGPRLRIIL
jgi:hypothetical protein